MENVEQYFIQQQQQDNVMYFKLFGTFKVWLSGFLRKDSEVQLLRLNINCKRQ